MKGKRLDFDAPLISFRRITTASLLPEDAALQSLRQALRNGRVKDSGAVPFFWEKTPGQPKGYPSNASICGGAANQSTETPKTLLDRSLKGSVGELMKNDLSPKFDSDPNQTQLRYSSDGVTDKYLVRGVDSSPADSSSLCANPSFRDSSCNFSKGPKTEEFMMGLFLPAAEAVASESRP